MAFRGGALGPDLDCSGLTQWAFAAAGVWIPRDAYQQRDFAVPIEVSEARCGDLVRSHGLPGPLFCMNNNIKKHAYAGQLNCFDTSRILLVLHARGQQASLMSASVADGRFCPSLM